MPLLPVAKSGVPLTRSSLRDILVPADHPTGRRRLSGIKRDTETANQQHHRLAARRLSVKGWLRASAVPVSKWRGVDMAMLSGAGGPSHARPQLLCEKHVQGARAAGVDRPGGTRPSGVVATRIHRGPRDHQPLEVAYSRLSTNGPTFCVTRTPNKVSDGAWGCRFHVRRCERNITVAPGSALCTD